MHDFFSLVATQFTVQSPCVSLAKVPLFASTAGAQVPVLLCWTRCLFVFGMVARGFACGIKTRLESAELLTFCAKTGEAVQRTIVTAKVAKLIMGRVIEKNFRESDNSCGKLNPRYHCSGPETGPVARSGDHNSGGIW